MARVEEEEDIAMVRVVVRKQTVFASLHMVEEELWVRYMWAEHMGLVSWLAGESTSGRASCGLVFARASSVPLRTVFFLLQRLRFEIREDVLRRSLTIGLSLLLR